MRYLRDIPDPAYKISLYQWNGKYIIKFEVGGQFEQIFKLDQTEVASEDEIDLILDEKFRHQVVERFKGMHQDFMDSLRRNEIIF